jgi:hypothetical protein
VTEARVEEQEAALELLSDRVIERDRGHAHSFICVEADEAEAAVSSDVLVLLADTRATALDLDRAGLGGDSRVSDFDSVQGIKRAQESDRVRARAAQAGSVAPERRSRRDGQSALDAHEPQRLAGERMSQMSGAVDDFTVVVTQLDLLVDSATHHHLDVPIDRSAEHCAAVSPIERR